MSSNTTVISNNIRFIEPSLDPKISSSKEENVSLTVVSTLISNPSSFSSTASLTNSLALRHFLPEKSETSRKVEQYHANAEKGDAKAQFKLANHYLKKKDFKQMVL